MTDPAPRFVEVGDAEGRLRWRLDAGFLTSNWSCQWGRGCPGIHDELRPELQDGCCSVGVVLADEGEARDIAALAATLDPKRFQQAHEVAVGRGVVERRGAQWATRVVEGACVFFNRPGHAGGVGCTLHLAALASGEPPHMWKPLTCGRMPVRAEEQTRPDGITEITVRAWRRDDWGPGGATMAWWCTEAAEAFDGDRPVHEAMGEELRELLGEACYAEAVRRMTAIHEE